MMMLHMKRCGDSKFKVLGVLLSATSQSEESMINLGKYSDIRLPAEQVLILCGRRHRAIR